MRSWACGLLRGGHQQLGNASLRRMWRALVAGQPRTCSRTGRTDQAAAEEEPKGPGRTNRGNRERQLAFEGTEADGASEEAGPTGAKFCKVGGDEGVYEAGEAGAGGGVDVGEGQRAAKGGRGTGKTSTGLASIDGDIKCTDEVARFKAVLAETKRALPQQGGRQGSGKGHEACRDPPPLKLGEEIVSSAQ